MPKTPSDKKIEDSVPFKPTISNAVRTSLNLAVLQRHLPSTVSIDFIAPIAYVYTINAITQSWEKTGIEGSLFVVKLQDEGRAIVVLNRFGLDNFILRLKSADHVDTEDGLIILHEKRAGGLGHGDVYAQKLWGLVIFEKKGESTEGVREACGRYILECARKELDIRSVDGQSNGNVQQQPTPGAPSGPDLMALLNPSRGQDSNHPPVV